jgi:hypothetical protein
MHLQLLDGLDRAGARRVARRRQRGAHAARARHPPQLGREHVGAERRVRAEPREAACTSGSTMRTPVSTRSSPCEDSEYSNACMKPPERACVAPCAQSYTYVYLHFNGDAYKRISHMLPHAKGAAFA